MSLEKNKIRLHRSVRLNAYRPQLSQPVHLHSVPHLSLVLGGSLIEESGDQERGAGPGMFAVRASEFIHQVRFGSGGALIISLGLSQEQFEGLGAADVGRWMDGGQALVRSVIGSALREGSEAALEEGVWDVLAGTSAISDSGPPLWLSNARDRLVEEDTTIASLAEAAGVHRVYFSRAFARAFGLPPTLYRRRIRGFRAVEAAIDGRPAARSAYECGFADQSHMARVIRHFTGTSYRQLRRLGAEVTSVQE